MGFIQQILGSMDEPSEHCRSILQKNLTLVKKIEKYTI